jgi:hypothetical protein
VRGLGRPGTWAAACRGGDEFSGAAALAPGGGSVGGDLGNSADLDRQRRRGAFSPQANKGWFGVIDRVPTFVPSWFAASENRTCGGSCFNGRS